MLKKYLLYLLFSLIVSAIVGTWWHYKKNHPDPNATKLHQAIENKVQNDPQYKIIQDLQDEKKSITE